MHTTYTSGAARRNAIDAERAANGATASGLYINRINAESDAAGRVNPILDYFRDATYNGDPDLHYQASEWLFQLGRHWNEWQSERIGTFPLEMRDYAGPMSREDSEASGEDWAYWYIMEALDEHADAENRVQDYIVHATAVLTRLYTMSGE